MCDFNVLNPKLLGLDRTDIENLQKQVKALNIKNEALQDKNEALEELIKDQRAFIEELKASKKLLSSKLITQQEDTQGALQFLDALENLLLDHGFKVVSING